MATLNLRVDWLARASMTESLLVTARCESYADDVAHVRGEAFSLEWEESRGRSSDIYAWDSNTPRDGASNGQNRADDHE